MRVQACFRCGWKRPANRGERGSAVAEFVMISTMLVVIAVSLVQFVLVLHVRNTLIDAASNGAHYGALANRSPADAESRTRVLITESLHGGFAEDIQTSVGTTEAGQLVTVTVRTQVPLVGLLPTGWNLTVIGEAVRYG